MGKLFASSPFVKAIRLTLHIIYALALVVIYPAVGPRSQDRMVLRWSQQVLKILQVRRQVSTPVPAATLAGGMLVANHISWLDMVAINAISPARFVAKAQVAQWPLLGWLVRRSGTLFIQREIRRDVARINQQVQERLLRGECIALFPEGTSTDGTQPVHFHSSLLQSAIDAGTQVYPVAISYHDGEGRAVPGVAFDGDMTFVSSLRKVLGMTNINVRVQYLPAVTCRAFSRRGVALRCQDLVNTALHRV